MKLVIAGGGTGGHLFPGVAIAESLLELDARNEVLFVGTERGIEVRAVPKAGFRLALIDIAGLKRKSLVQRITTLGRLPGSLLQSRRVLREFRADAVIGVGGYASGPVVVAAWLMGLPTAIHEQNSVPGVTNKILSRLVRKVFVTFAASLPHFPAQKTSLVGNPVRRTFREAAARPAGPFEEGLVFIFGGSQGARPLNETAPSALRLLQDEGLKVRALHQAGNDAVAGVEAAYREAGVQATVTSFIDEMVEAYRRAHVVICRAGATSCAEITALGVPAILVPFPQAADDHQTKNAADLVAQGAAVLLPQAEMTPERLAVELRTILGGPDRRVALANGARQAGRLEASTVIARSSISGFTTPTATLSMTKHTEDDRGTIT